MDMRDIVSAGGEVFKAANGSEVFYRRTGCHIFVMVTLLPLKPGQAEMFNLTSPLVENLQTFMPDGTTLLNVENGASLSRVSNVTQLIFGGMVKEWMSAEGDLI